MKPQVAFKFLNPRCGLRRYSISMGYEIDGIVNIPYQERPNGVSGNETYNGITGSIPVDEG